MNELCERQHEMKYLCDDTKFVFVLGFNKSPMNGDDIKAHALDLSHLCSSKHKKQSLVMFEINHYCYFYPFACSSRGGGGRDGRDGRDGSSSQGQNKNNENSTLADAGSGFTPNILQDSLLESLLHNILFQFHVFGYQSYVPHHILVYGCHSAFVRSQYLRQLCQDIHYYSFCGADK
ncbi:hypothetical protein RFI_33385, partial [Reticulomyxa filosa]